MADFDNSGIHELMKDVSRRAFLAWAHGKDSLGYYEALRKEGLMEDEHEVAYTALKERQAGQGSIVTSSMRPSAEAGLRSLRHAAHEIIAAPHFGDTQIRRPTIGGFLLRPFHGHG